MISPDYHPDHPALCRENKKLRGSREFNPSNLFQRFRRRSFDDSYFTSSKRIERVLKGADLFHGAHTKKAAQVPTEPQDEKPFLVFLEEQFDLINEIDLNSSETYSLSSLKELVEEAHKNKSDYIFVFIKDEAYGTYIFDGLSFCKGAKWVRENQESSHDLINPLNNQAIVGGNFYIIYADQTLPEIQEHSAISFLGSLDDIIEEGSLGSKLIGLSDCSMENSLQKWVIEISLVKDLLAGTNVLSQNRELAIEYTRKRSEENPLCKLLLAACTALGIGVKEDRAEAGKLIREVLEQQTDAEKIYQNIKSQLEKDQNLNSMKSQKTVYKLKPLFIAPGVNPAHTTRIFNPHSYLGRSTSHPESIINSSKQEIDL